MTGRFVASLALLAIPAAIVQAQTLTPMGPVQQVPSRGQALPTVQTPSPRPGAIQGQALPSLTAPDPAYANAPVPSPAAPRPAPPMPLPAGQAAAPTDAASGTPIPGDWQPRGAAELIALDKVTARPTQLSVKVGETAKFGTLAITVRGCDVRAPDQPADATAFLDITDHGAPTPLFHGWMFAAYPAIAVFQHPVYDVRVAGCR